MRVAVTGLGLLTAAGAGVEPFRDALGRGTPLGAEEEVRVSRGAARAARVARITGFEPAAWVRPGALRRMSPEAQILTGVLLAGWNGAGAPGRPVPPERVGTFLGTGFGCLTTTPRYLRGIFAEGMAAASPFLFAESLASSPLGHAAIEIDARGPSMAFGGGDASVIPALDEACRAIRSGRIDRAVCTTFDLMSPELLGILVRLARRRNGAPHIGEGAAAIILEDLETALASGATILAEILGAGQAGDPAAKPNDWSADPEIWAAAHARALERAGARGRSPDIIFRHAPPSRRAAEAEMRALASVAEREPGGRRPGASVVDVHRVFGAYAAAGALSIAAAILACAGQAGPAAAGASRAGAALVSAGSWGGATGAAVIASPGA